MAPLSPAVVGRTDDVQHPGHPFYGQQRHAFRHQPYPRPAGESTYYMRQGRGGERWNGQ